MITSRKTLLVLGDSISFIIGFFAFIGLAFPRTAFLEQSYAHAIPLTILTLIWIGIFFIFNFYEIQSSKPNLLFIRNFVIAGLIMLGVGFIFFYINPVTHISPKTNLLIFEGISLVIVFAWRRIFYLITSRTIHTRLAIICNDERHQTLLDEINNNPHLGYLCAGTYPTLQAFEQSHQSIDMLIVHKTAIEESDRLESFLASSTSVIDLAEAYELILYKIPVHFITTQWIIHSIKKQGDAFYHLASRIISIIFALVVIVITLPITLITALLIWGEDRGTVFYSQLRTGLHGKTFRIYKFRSMFLNAESRGAVWSSGDADPRITRIGKVIRKLHIDEIPQMINLLKGDLTLVGPRPERPEFVTDLEQQIPYYFMRHTITPGFTGWAQIKFRYARTILDSEEKFEYDLFYIKNRNLFLDIGIILKTAQIVFTHAGK